MKIFRVEQFNAAHRLFNPKWDNETNDRIFGKCNNPNFHGHNYKLEVELEGPVNPETGYVMDMKELSNIIKENVLVRFDHKNLNLDTEYFRNVNPTAENICIAIYNILRSKIDQRLDMQVRLYETERNFVEYPVL